MPDTDTQNVPVPQAMTDNLKSWTMLIVTLIFVMLYAGTFTGAIKAPDAVKDLQPIIFVIIGYYFGRLPSQQNEDSLKEEITRQANKADAATNTKEKVLHETGALEERIRNTRTILETGKTGTDANAAAVGSPMVESALKVLNS